MVKFLFILFAFATFLKPSCFDLLGFDTINMFFNISRIFVAGIIFINYLFIKRKPLSRLLRYECLFFAFWFISTLISDEGIEQLLVFSISIIAFTMLIELLIAQDVKLLINTLFINYFILITANFIYMISIFGFTINIEENATSLYDFYTKNAVVSLLNTVNTVASFLFPALCCAILLMLGSSKKNLFAWLLIFEIFATALILWSATTLVGIFLITCYILFIYKTSFEKYIRPSLIIFTVILLGLGVTFFRIQYLFSFIIEDVLHKSLSMTGRTTAWNIGFNGFFSSPILGCGFSSKIIDNGYVQLLFLGGLLGCISYSIFLYSSIIQFCRKKSTSLEKFFSVVFSAIFLMFIAESWTHFMGLYIILTFAVNARKIELKLTTIKQHENYCRPNDSI